MIPCTFPISKRYPTPLPTRGRVNLRDGLGKQPQTQRTSALERERGSGEGLDELKLIFKYTRARLMRKEKGGLGDMEKRPLY